MRALGIHETVMQLMVNTLNKAQQQSAAVADIQKRRASVGSADGELEAEPAKVIIKLLLYTLNNWLWR